jgi:hypothetical protein
MRGLRMVRAISPDGRRAYTLYNGGGRPRDEAFIHILDTVDGISHCIELPDVSGREAWNLQLDLSSGGSALNVRRGSHLLASMDTKTYAVTIPRPLEPATGGRESERGGASGLTIGAIIAGFALLAGAAFAARRRRGGSLPPDPFGPGEPQLAPTEQPEEDRAVS